MPSVTTAHLKHWLNHVQQTHNRTNWELLNGVPCLWCISQVKDGTDWFAQRKEIFDLKTGRIRFEKLEEN
jgi:hypothetical protein